MELRSNVVHYMSGHITTIVADALMIDSTQEGTTTCGARIGGMLFRDLTDDTIKVTCPNCLNHSRYPLDILAHTPL